MSRRYYSILFCFVAIIAVVTATDYCSKEICINGDHIACNHNGKFDSNCSSDAEIVILNDHLRNVLIDAHNNFRNEIASGIYVRHKPACRMATMEWDDELAKHAALNVLQCKMAKDKCHNTPAFKYSGQNLAWMAVFDEPDHADKLAQAVQIWFSEINNNNQNYADSYPSDYSGPVNGHLSVMLGDRNNRLGCAASTFTEKGKKYKTYLVVCNYATANLIGFPIYVTCSEPAISCTTGRNPNYNNLCSVSEQYDVNKWL